MRVPISGIALGFRIIKGVGKDASDYGKLFISQVADKDHDAVLITIFIQDVKHIEYLLNHYSNGELRWIDIYANHVMDGREKIWMLENIFGISEEIIPIEGIPE